MGGHCVESECYPRAFEAELVELEFLAWADLNFLSDLDPLLALVGFLSMFFDLAVKLQVVLQLHRVSGFHINKLNLGAAPSLHF